MTFMDAVIGLLVIWGVVILLTLYVLWRAWVKGD